MNEDIPSFVTDHLDSIASISAGAIARIVEVFVRTGRERVTGLLGALEACDWEQVNALAHSLKGSSSSVGAVKLSRIAGALEAHATLPNPEMTPEIEGHRAELLPEFERARAGVEAYLLALDS
jgi:HPt (histidine-containing phosphotransfer) domain-containing protein